MSTLIQLNESNGSRRCVPIWCIRSSDGTSAATNESGRTFFFSVGGVDYGSGGSLSAISSDMGLYSCNFSGSKVSVAGQGFVYYGLPNSSGTALPVSAPFTVVGFDSFDSMRLGLFALPNAGAALSGGLITVGTGTGQLNVSAGSVGILAATHSGVTIQGLTNYANISNVTLAAGTHSGATVQGVSRINSGVTLNADVHSGASVEIKAGGIQTTSIGVGTYSSVTFQGISNPDPVADALLNRNVAGGSSTGRLVKEALYVLRNKVAVQTSAMTVYQTDDATSAWTAVVSTGTLPISTVDPVA